LLGVRAVGQDRRDQRPSQGADPTRPLREAGRRPLQVALMGLGHVRRVRRVAPGRIVADVGRDPLPAMEGLDGRGGDASVNDLVDERKRHGVVVTVELDVVIDVDARALPLAVDEGLGRQRPEGEPHAPAVEVLAELTVGQTGRVLGLVERQRPEVGSRRPADLARRPARSRHAGRLPGWARRPRSTLARGSRRRASWSGTLPRRLRIRWARHRCRSARGKQVSTARIRPGAPSVTTSRGSASPRRFLRPRGQVQQDLAALLRDPPGTEHRLAGHPGVQPLRHAVDEQVGHPELAQIAGREGLVLLPEPLSDLAHGSPAQQALAVAVPEGGLNVPGAQAPGKQLDGQSLQGHLGAR
jgi:hypothetical protein